MKKWTFYLLSLLLAITTGCKTCGDTVAIEYLFPEEPQRMHIDLESQSMIEILTYYEFLTEEWEAWASDVKKIVGYLEE